MTEMVIYALPVGGGILALSPVPGGGGTYAADLKHIAAWKPAIVVSLTTNKEMLDAGAHGFGADIQDNGTRWVHMPIQDFGTPNTNFESAWKDVSAAIRAALHGGGRVLVHCKAGQGRSGMVALRVMIEAGADPAAALDRLRAVRPGAVETDDQMVWAKRVDRSSAVFVRHSE
ncbi:MAG: dual specificity protein phosphatase family protein [Rhodobacteraceae bacterium]|nr:dual specificity protein phosphatase family protein [Paracoccaceae bacterium]